MSASNDRQRDRLVIPFSVAVLCGWLGSLVFAMLAREYAPLTAVSPVMIILAGYICGSNIVRGAVERGSRDRSGTD